MKHTCIIEGCEKNRYGNGYCRPHWYGNKQYGDPLAVREYLKGGGTGKCSIEECHRLVRAKRFCTKHLDRFTKYGSPYITKYATPGSGHINKRGYKIIRCDGKAGFEHKFIVEQKLGRSLTNNEDIHHLDGNKLNNHLNNLIVLSKSDHSKLHNYYKLYV